MSKERCCRTCAWWQKEISGFDIEWARSCVSPVPQFLEGYRVNPICFADSGKKCRVWQESEAMTSPETILIVWPA